jgi:hypothetical protein
MASTNFALDERVSASDGNFHSISGGSSLPAAVAQAHLFAQVDPPRLAELVHAVRPADRATCKAPPSGNGSS